MGFCSLGCCKSKKDPELFVSRHNRWCTDIIFLIAFILAFAGDIALTIYSINRDPQLLTDMVYPPDSYGNNCGQPNTATANMPKMIFSRLDQDIIEQMDVLATYRYWDFNPTRLCAAECPEGFNLANPNMYGGANYPCGYDLSSGDGDEIGSGSTCTYGSVPSTYYMFVTQDVIGRCFPFEDSAQAGAREICTTPSCETPSLNASFNGDIACTTVDAYPDVLTAWEVCPVGMSPDSAYCTTRRAQCNLVISEKRTDEFVPSSQTAQSREFSQNFATYTKTVIGGIKGCLVTEAAVAQALCGIVLPILMAFIWAILLWFFAGVIIYTLIIGLCAALLTAAFWFMYKAGWFGDSVDLVSISGHNSSLLTQAEHSEQTWYGVLSVVALVLGAIVTLFFFASRKAIKRLIAIVQECTKVFRTLAAIVVWPIIFQLPLELAFVAYGVFTGYFIIMVYAELATMVFLLIIHILFILWACQTVKAVIWSSMSAAVGVWFTTVNAADCEDRGWCKCSFGCVELWAGTSLIVMKHIGSCAFGALIIGICQLIRLILTAIDYYTQDLQDKNLLLKIVMKCSQCVMYCLQKTIEFISYFGYIFVAIKGYGFCRACGATFGFIAKYPTQTAVNKTVQALLRLLIGWSIPIVCTLVCFFVLDSLTAYQDYTAYLPALIVFIASYLIADGICTVYDCCIDTIYLSSFEDMERDGGPKYMSADLKAGFGIDDAPNEASKRANKYRAVSARRQEGKCAGKVTVLKVGNPAASGGGCESSL